MSIRNATIRQYIFDEPGNQSSLRSVLLFGKNTATYKFALCEALLKQQARSEQPYVDLLPHFVDALCRHVKIYPKQETRSEPRSLISACIKFNEGALGKSELLKEGAKVMPRYVFNAFHNIGGGSLDAHHSLFSDNRKLKRLDITDTLLKIIDNDDMKEAMLLENESRWRVVEEAWRLGFNPALLAFDENASFVLNSDRRAALRPVFPTLLPYQKGLCFYCRRGIKLSAVHHDENFGDVDHCIPRSVLQKIYRAGIDTRANLNGIWNLVIACQRCNRGEGGKFDQIPALQYYEQLCVRNQRFALEHAHSLRYAIFWSLNASSVDEIIEKMQEIWNLVPRTDRWRPKEMASPMIDL